ncbi:sporulation membrane protein YtaF [Ammoniphilus sp. CFH 90114]|uniref:sporulation membrane protein YtaF n=1 Tax=Ammoniphilus sp. CFH 90114 TaxID=2493665 RepID=UPI00100F1766|nr:sporulation membrane protein YtaF [Ammoniphilus sp. CFH 90114]RXT04770.1 sporulation membrane protein YtaF [Ammoniphilus sp. CFH 90114]
MEFFSLFALAFAVSLDSFGVGISYGLRRIKIPILSILIITSCSAVLVLVSMQLGKWFSGFISMGTANLIGAFILIGIGCWAIFNLYLNRETNQIEPPLTSSTTQVDTLDSSEPRQVLNIEIKTLGLVIHILKKPTAADVDRSGTITGAEAAVLGVALSLDGFGAGIGAALMGYSPWLTAVLFSVLCTTFILMGLRLGFVYSNSQWIKRMSFIPGVILILFGISKIL